MAEASASPPTPIFAFMGGGATGSAIRLGHSVNGRQPPRELASTQSGGVSGRRRGAPAFAQELGSMRNLLFGATALALAAGPAAATVVLFPPAGSNSFIALYETDTG